jgi:hypothetical protein
LSLMYLIVYKRCRLYLLFIIALPLGKGKEQIGAAALHKFIDLLQQLLPEEMLPLYPNHQAL